jgi:hypothetical protein
MQVFDCEYICKHLLAQVFTKIFCEKASMACVLAGHHWMVKIRDFGKVSWSVGKQTMDGRM